MFKISKLHCRYYVTDAAGGEFNCYSKLRHRCQCHTDNLIDYINYDDLLASALEIGWY